jgi:hypothetical protein
MSDRDFWLGAAKRLALRRNVALWSELFIPPGLTLTIAAAVLLLALRLAGGSSHWLWPCWGISLALAAAICAAIAWRRHFTLPNSLARLDEVGRLHNRLVCAHAGIGPWPAPKPGVRDSVRWNWSRLALPVLIGALLLTAAALVEIPRLTLTARPNEEPIAWTQLESWLKTLDQAKIIDQPALDKLKEQVNDLRNQPEKDWYSQSSLEAGDALRQQTGNSLHSLAQNLEHAAALMAQAQQAGQMSTADLQTISNSLKDLAQGMTSGNLAADKEMTGRLGAFDPSTLRTMSAAEMQALQQRMASGSKICAACVGPSIGPGNGIGGDGHRNGGASAWSLQKDGKGASGHPGGGGPADLALDDISENLHTKRLEGDSNPDPKRAVPGEVLAITKGKHNVDKTLSASPVEAGAISSAGEGGDAVWRDSLTPDDREVLQKYFK